MSVWDETAPAEGEERGAEEFVGRVVSVTLNGSAGDAIEGEIVAYDASTQSLVLRRSFSFLLRGVIVSLTRAHTPFLAQRRREVLADGARRTE